MSHAKRAAVASSAVRASSTIFGVLELNKDGCIVTIQLPGAKRRIRRVLDADGQQLTAFLKRLAAQCAAAGNPIARIVLTNVRGDRPSPPSSGA